MSLLRALRTTSARRVVFNTRSNISLFTVQPPIHGRFYSDVKVTTDLIKKLRAETDAPLGQCKKALEESNADLEKAKEWLRKKGLQTAQSKSSRTAQEGLVTVLTNEQNSVGVIVEINCETDFVVRNEQFQSVVARVSDAVLKHANTTQDNGELDIEKMKTEVKVDGKPAGDTVAELAGIIRENIQLRRIFVLRAKDNNGVVAAYIHNTKSANAGSIGALVEVSGEQPREKLQSFAREVAMHIVGMEPKYLSKEQVPQNVIEYERGLAREKAIKDGKSQDVLEKIVDGQIKKFYSQVTLVDQPWIMDQKQSVEKICKSSGVTIVNYLRVKCGDQSN